MSGFGASSTPVNAQPVYSGLNVSTSQLNIPVTLFWGMRRISPNAIDYDGFQKHPVSGKGKGGGAKGGTQYDYTADVIQSLGEGPFDSIQNIWATGSTTTTTSLSALNMTLFSGTADQAPWSFWASKYPSKARSYSRTAYLGAPNLDLGESATIPDNAFECVRTAGFAYVQTSDGWINPATHAVSPGKDCLLSDIIPDFLTNVQYGMGWTNEDLGPIALFAAYQRAQGLFFSPLLNTQTKATDLLDRWAQLGNSWVFWSGTRLEFVPLGDSVVTGNGVTYAPQLDVAYTLTLDDLIAPKGSAPVAVTRKDPADCYNHTSLSITDRTRGYISNPFDYKDDQLVDQFGLRDNTSVEGDDICDPNVARIAVQLIGKRAAYIRNTYSFKTSHRFILCLPGTVLVIPLNFTGLSVRVRVTDVGEDDKGNLSFTAEEFPGTVGTYVPPIGVAAIATPSTPNLYADPGSVNTPAIFELAAASTGNQSKIIVAASGGAAWGGCDVYLGFDGLAYSKVGSITAAATQGVLTAALGLHADPDTVDTLAIDCTQSLASQATVTHLDADQLRTLSLIAPQPIASGEGFVIPAGGELLAFGGVASTGTYTADLSYLRRGQYGSAPAAHAAGEQFTLIAALGTDGTSISYDLPAAYVGQPLYIKLASFNVFGLMTQDLSTCAEYVYTPLGVGAPAVGDWTLAPTALGNGGANTPALLITGRPPNYISDWVVEVRARQGVLNEDGTPLLMESGAPLLSEAIPGPWNADSVQPSTADVRTVSNGIANEGIYEVAISYRIGDQVGDRLILGPVVAGALAVASGAHTVRSFQPAYPVSADDTHVIVTACTAQIDDGRTLAIPATTISGLASGATFGVFYHFPTNTCICSPQDSLAEMGSSDNVFLGWYTTTMAGVVPPATPAPATYGGTDPNCVVDDTLILMANDRRDGPGSSMPARALTKGLWVWTRPELENGMLGPWGAYQLAGVSFAEEPVFTAPNYPRATPRHRFWIGERWTMMEEIGVPVGSARVARITVDTARTYVAAGIISHNIKVAA